MNGKFEITGYLSENCVDLIKKILTVNPKKRIGIDGIKKHPFLNKAVCCYHIDDILNRIEKGKYCEVVIERMLNMTEFNFTRENIIYNLDNNKHNNITTTYELLLKRYKM